MPHFEHIGTAIKQIRQLSDVLLLMSDLSLRRIWYYDADQNLNEY